ncbi:hypothetical protein Tco_1035794 [Tanacetum coccineum]
MLEEKCRDLCEEASNFVKEIEDVVKEVERLSCKDVAKETETKAEKVSDMEIKSLWGNTNFDAIVSQSLVGLLGDFLNRFGSVLSVVPWIRGILNSIWLPFLVNGVLPKEFQFHRA